MQTYHKYYWPYRVEILVSKLGTLWFYCLKIECYKYLWGRVLITHPIYFNKVVFLFYINKELLISVLISFLPIPVLLFASLLNSIWFLGRSPLWPLFSSVTCFYIFLFTYQQHWPFFFSNMSIPLKVISWFPYLK